MLVGLTASEAVFGLARVMMSPSCREGKKPVLLGGEGTTSCMASFILLLVSNSSCDLTIERVEGGGGGGGGDRAVLSIEMRVAARVAVVVRVVVVVVDILVVEEEVVVVEIVLVVGGV